MAEARSARRVVPLFAALSALSILQGILDFGAPALLGTRPFAFTYSLASHGAPLLFLAIFLHNAGLALLLPGVGFLAMRAERREANRRALRVILLTTAIAAAAMGLVYVLGGRGTFDLKHALILLAGETAALLLVALAAFRAMAPMVAARPDDAAWTRALVALRAPIAVSLALLALLAALETSGPLA